jgi:predicted transposase YdaD
MLDISFEQTRLYQDLKQQAEEQGLERGLERGLGQGRQEEAIKLVLRILAKKFREVPTQLSRQIEDLSLQNLEALADALLDFDSLDDLVSWLQRLARVEQK